MASENEEAKSAQNANEMKCEEMNETAEKLHSEQRNTHNKETENEFFDAVKDDDPSDNESEPFEDAVEDHWTEI